MINLRFPGTGGLGSARSRKKLSKDYRRFPTLLINEKILIDPSEDIFEFEESFMLSGIFKDARDIFITNSALDHLSICCIEKMAAKAPVRVYATEAVRGEISSIPNVEFIPISPFSLVRVAEFGILPLPANFRTENPGEVALNFLIECEGKTFFYGLDGAWLNPDAFRFLKEAKLDAVILDCALGTRPYSVDCINHNNLAMAAAVKDILLSAGIVSDSTKFILSHLPTGKSGSVHDELCEAVKDTPFKVAYDGYYLGI